MLHHCRRAMWLLTATFSIAAGPSWAEQAAPAGAAQPPAEADPFGQAEPEAKAAQPPAEADPFGQAAPDAKPAEPAPAAGPEEPAAQPAPKAAPAAAKANPPDAKAAAKEPPAAKAPEIDDPVVNALLETKPTTPRELVRAAKILADLDQPALAKTFLKQVLDAKPDDKALAALSGEFGTAVFTQLALRADLNPEAKQLFDTVLSGADRYARDPKEIQAAIKQLTAASEDARYAAVLRLRQARVAAVAPMVAALADPARGAEHAAIRAALVELGPEMVAPLLGVLESPDAALKAQAIEVLGALEATEAISYLLAPLASPTGAPAVREAAARALAALGNTKTPTNTEAAAMLYHHAVGYFQHSRPLTADVAGRVELWGWDEAKKQSVATVFPVDQASLEIASRLARDLYQIVPGSLEARRLYLASMLEAASYRAGLDKPLANDFVAKLTEAGLKDDAFEDVLTYCQSTGHLPAAAAAARIVGQLGKADLLSRNGATLSPLVLAAMQRDPRLRFAAIEAIVHLKPTRTFPGSSYVPEALGYFVETYTSLRETTPAAANSAIPAAPAKQLPSLAERRQQAMQSLVWLAELSGPPRSIYDLSRVERQAEVALTDPDLSLQAALVLANLGTPAAQRALVDLASRTTQPLPIRRAAASAFFGTVRRNGILLTSKEVLLQYDRYNQSETQDKATQDLLAAILDCLEARMQANVPAAHAGDKSPTVTP
ncbi:MAG: HEAT repeat domain-containing protein [Pirellulales bacterium]